MGFIVFRGMKTKTTQAYSPQNVIISRFYTYFILIIFNNIIPVSNQLYVLRASYGYFVFWVCWASAHYYWRYLENLLSEFVGRSPFWEGF